MSNSVTVSDFRENLSKYIDMVQKKRVRVDIVDGRKGMVLATLVKSKEKLFDWEAHLKWMEDFKPVFTNEDASTIKQSRESSSKRIKKLNW